MKVTKIIGGLLMLVAFNGCKVHKEAQKSTSRVDSTTTSSTEVAKATTLLQQHKNNRLDSSHTSGQNIYQRQIVAYQFTPDTNGRELKGLENRLTGITVTTEEGTQAIQTGSLTRQNSDGLSMAKDSSKSEEKKNTVLNKAQEEQHTETTRTGGHFPLWLIVLLLIVVAVIILWIRKGNPFLLLIGWLRKAGKDSTPPPSTPA